MSTSVTLPFPYAVYNMKNNRTQEHKKERPFCVPFVSLLCRMHSCADTCYIIVEAIFLYYRQKEILLWETEVGF